VPIKTENRARYPADWKAIRERIRLRAGDRCESCGVPNLLWVLRSADDPRQWQAAVDEPTIRAVRRVLFFLTASGRLGTPAPVFMRPVRVVCTVAHLDHTPENCDPANLRFWCNLCHLRYDLEHHVATARQTRIDKRLAGGSLFDGSEA
jgi:hypothetical protein